MTLTWPSNYIHCLSESTKTDIIHSYLCYIVSSILFTFSDTKYSFVKKHKTFDILCGRQNYGLSSFSVLDRLMAFPKMSMS